MTEIGVPYTEASPGLFTVNAPYVCTRLIASVYDAGVRILNRMKCEDVILNEYGRAKGVLIRWTFPEELKNQDNWTELVGIEIGVIIDATGEEAYISRRLSEKGLLNIRGCGAIEIERGEELLLENTGEVYPGVLLAGGTALWFMELLN